MFLAYSHHVIYSVRDLPFVYVSLVINIQSSDRATIIIIITAHMNIHEILM